jgi:hypothetical protein
VRPLLGEVTRKNGPFHCEARIATGQVKVMGFGMMFSLLV